MLELRQRKQPFMPSGHVLFKRKDKACGSLFSLPPCKYLKKFFRFHIKPP